MQYIQPILVYVILAIAVGYLLKKFFLPKSFFATKKTKQNGCGQEDCGCH